MGRRGGEGSVMCVNKAWGGVVERGVSYACEPSVGGMVERGQLRV